MNITTRLFLLFVLLVLTTGCGTQTSATNPNVDHLFTFDENGQATARGKISGDYECSTVNGKLRARLNINVPVLVDGIASNVDLTFTLTFDTQLASDLTPYTTLRDYLDANPASSTFDAFPLFQTVDVTFIKKDDSFEAVAIRQVDTIESPVTEINGMLSTNIFSKGTLNGTIAGSNWGDDLVTWTLSMPVTVSSTPASVVIPIESKIDTPVIVNGSDIPMDIYHPGGHVQVEFRRNEDTLEAIRFIEMP